MKEEESSFNLEIKAEADAKSLRRSQNEKEELLLFKVTEALDAWEKLKGKKLSLEKFLEPTLQAIKEEHPEAFKRLFSQYKDSTSIKIQTQIEDDKFTNALNEVLEKNKHLLENRKTPSELFKIILQKESKKLKASHPAASKRFWPENTKLSQNRSDSPKGPADFFSSAEGSTTPPTTPATETKNKIINGNVRQ